MRAVEWLWIDLLSSQTLYGPFHTTARLARMTTEPLTLQEAMRLGMLLELGVDSCSKQMPQVPPSRLTRGYHLRYSHTKEEMVNMARKEITDKLSIYIPQSKIGQKPVERLITLGEKRDRSVNYLVVEAILKYLDLEEQR